MNEVDPKAKQQIVEKIKSSKNILVIVSKNPSVDDLSAAIGLTALLNKSGKHATAIFSGILPPAISFLDPSKVFENTVNSLRDFIIALDKEKADHLRYKIDGDLVKIFITPYRTTISGDDLEFSQGDYNVELVLALGVSNRENLDLALASDSQVLSDADVVTFCAGSQTSDLGSISWRDENAGCLSEMIMSLSETLKTDKPLLDKQIATAILTGIVAATDRFSNDKTTSKIMTMSAQLMAAGADQQLIAAKLREAHEIHPNIEIPKPEKKPELRAPKEEKQKLVIAPLTIEAPVESVKVEEKPEIIEQPEQAKEPEPVVVPDPITPPEQSGTLTISHDPTIVTGPVASTLPPEDFQVNLPEIPIAAPSEGDLISTIPPEQVIDNYITPVPALDTPEVVAVAPEVPVEYVAPKVEPASDTSSFISQLSALASQAASENKPANDPIQPTAAPEVPIIEPVSSIIDDSARSYLGAPGQGNVNDNVFGLTPDDSAQNVDIFASGLAQTAAPQIDLPMPPELPDFSSLPPVDLSAGIPQIQPVAPTDSSNSQPADPGQFKIPS